MRKWTVRVVLVLMFLALQGPATLASAGDGASIDGADHPCGYGFGGGLAVAVYAAVVD